MIKKYNILKKVDSVILYIVFLIDFKLFLDSLDQLKLFCNRPKRLRLFFYQLDAAFDSTVAAVASFLGRPGKRAARSL
jgi:hypothetical protein